MQLQMNRKCGKLGLRRERSWAGEYYIVAYISKGWGHVYCASHFYCSAQLEEGCGTGVKVSRESQPATAIWTNEASPFQ